LDKEQVAELVKAERDLLRAQDTASLYRKKYSTLQRDYIALRKEYEAVHELKETPIKKHHFVAKKGSGGQAVPLINLSDWHVEEEVRQQDVGITKAIIVLGGDFISGNIHEELLASCLLRPVDAIRFAEGLLTSGIEFLLEHSELELVIPCKIGNHGRITKKVHISGEVGNSLESAMYFSMAQTFRDEPRVQFIIEDSYLTHLKVFDKVVRIHHGHAIRYGGGIGGLHIPMRKAIGEWNKTKHAHFDMIGHYHSYANSTPTYACNGSLIGFNAFAMFIKGTYEPAIQSFNLLDAKRGITAQFPILCE
jgi:hypothetical protein